MPYHLSYLTGFFEYYLGIESVRVLNVRRYSNNNIIVTNFVILEFLSAHLYIQALRKKHFVFFLTQVRRYKNNEGRLTHPWKSESF